MRPLSQIAALGVVYPLQTTIKTKITRQDEVDVIEQEGQALQVRLHRHNHKVPWAFFLVRGLR